MVFDSLEFYENILNWWIPRILGSKSGFEFFNGLKIKALQERTTHIRRLKEGNNELYTSMTADEFNIKDKRL
jgi:hypothetical protein